MRAARLGAAWEAPKLWLASVLSARALAGAPPHSRNQDDLRRRKLAHHQVGALRITVEVEFGCGEWRI